MTTHTFLIAPGSSATGTRIARHVAAAGHTPRSLSRSTPIPFDWNSPVTWPSAVDGVTGAYLAFVPDLAVPGSAQTLAAFGAVAAGAGLRQLVLLSGRGEDQAETAEVALRSAGVPTAVVRSDWFAQNFSSGFLGEMTIDGVLALPVTDSPEPFVDLDDLAEAATSLLLSDRAVDETFELSGPEALTFGRAVDIIARVTGRHLAFASVSMPEFLSGLEAAGVDADYRALMDYLFSEVLDGRNSTPTGDLPRLLGRPATTFEQFVAREHAAGYWA